MGKEKMLLGTAGENAAETLLKKEGYEILEKNFRTRSGEIDLVARKGRSLVFVEVKTRTSEGFGLPEEAVDFRKQQRLRRLAGEYLSRMGGGGLEQIRFDVVAVRAERSGEIVDMKIIEEAF